MRYPFNFPNILVPFFHLFSFSYVLRNCLQIAWKQLLKNSGRITAKKHCHTLRQRSFTLISHHSSISGQNPGITFFYKSRSMKNHWQSRPYSLMISYIFSLSSSVSSPFVSLHFQLMPTVDGLFIRHSFPYPR